MTLDTSVTLCHVTPCLQGNQWNGKALMRTASGLASVLLSIKKCPMIRYQANSAVALKLAELLRVRQSLGVCGPYEVLTLI